VTGVEPITGPVDEQLAITKERLRGHKEAVSETMQRATNARVPIALLADRFQVSAREFLHSGAGWTPTAHSGTSDDIAVDDAVLNFASDWVFDPVTVLLLVAIGAQSLVPALPHKPKLTRQAAWQLTDWYMQERDGRRAIGHVQLAANGQLQVTAFGIRDRVAMLKFWRDVNQLISRHFAIIESPSLSTKEETLQLVNMLGTPTLTGLVAARHLDAALISEEEIVRGAATHIVGAKSASLHRFIVHAEQRGWISRTKATLALAALIQMGWTWVSFPNWMLDHALRLDEHKRWLATDIFLRRMRTAEPNVAIQTLLRALRKADEGGYRQLGVSHLRQSIYKALPRIAHSQRAHIADMYPNNDRKFRATRKMLKRWTGEP